MHREKKAQSTLEYITVFAVIVTVVVALAYNSLRPAVSNMLNTSASKITNATATF